MYSKISLPPMGKLQNGELIQYGDNAITIFNQNDPTALQLDKTLAEFINVFQSLPKVRRRRTKNALTADLKQLDKKRIQALRGLRKSLEISLLQDDEVLVRPAKLLYDDFMAQVGNTKDLTLPNKTSTINAFLQRWNEKPDFVAARGKVSVDTWLDKIAEHNKNFDNLYIERVNTTERSLSMTDKRATLIAVFQKLIRETEARALLAPTDTRYTELISRINALSASYSNHLKSRVSEKEPEPPLESRTGQVPESI